MVFCLHLRTACISRFKTTADPERKVCLRYDICADIKKKIQASDVFLHRNSSFPGCTAGSYVSSTTKDALSNLYNARYDAPSKSQGGKIRPDAEHIYSQVINAMRALWNKMPHWLPCVGGAQGVKCMSACLCALELAMMASIRAN